MRSRENNDLVTTRERGVFALAKRLAADDVDCELMVVKDASHAFDRLCDPDTPQWRAREEANQMIERRIRAAYTQEDV